MFGFITHVFDRLLLSLGLTCEELRRVRFRQAAYLGLVAMGIVATGLVGAIVNNLTHII